MHVQRNPHWGLEKKGTLYVVSSLLNREESNFNIGLLALELQVKCCRANGIIEQMGSREDEEGQRESVFRLGKGIVLRP